MALSEVETHLQDRGVTSLRMQLVDAGLIRNGWWLIDWISVSYIWVRFKINLYILASIRLIDLPIQEVSLLIMLKIFIQTWGVSPQKMYVQEENKNKYVADYQISFCGLTPLNEISNDASYEYVIIISIPLVLHPVSVYLY